MKEMKRLSIVWGLLLVGIFGALTTFGILWKNKYGKYIQLENKLSKAAEKFKDASSLDEKQKLKITLKELQDKSLIKEFKADDKECTGYVLIEKKNFVFEYNSFIKCEKYQTKGYQE